MKLSKKTHIEIRLRNLIFTILYLLLTGLLAWVSSHYSARFDWTQGHQHTLSEASKSVISRLDDRVHVTVFIRETPELRNPVEQLVDRYRAVCQCVDLVFSNPDTHPDQVRDLGVRMEGEALIEFKGRSEKISSMDESSLTSAIQRLESPEQRTMTFLSGHGERSPDGHEGSDLAKWASELQKKGIKSGVLNLALAGQIAPEVEVLVIAGPKTALLPGEVLLIEKYVREGGELLWLIDQGSTRGLGQLLEQLGLDLLQGTVVDASTQLVGIDDPTFALVVDYPPHSVTQGLQQMSVFPTANALKARVEGGFEKDPLLMTLDRSWTETGPISNKISHDADKGESKGPLALGYALTRAVPGSGKQQDSAQIKEQRIIVVGDGDFISDQFLGNGGNLELGTRMAQWLTHADSLINIPQVELPDRKIELTPFASGTIAVVFLIVMPIGFLGAGAWIWFRRRDR